MMGRTVVYSPTCMHRCVCAQARSVCSLCFARSWPVPRPTAGWWGTAVQRAEPPEMAANRTAPRIKRLTSLRRQTRPQWATPERRAQGSIRRLAATAVEEVQMRRSTHRLPPLASRASTLAGEPALPMTNPATAAPPALRVRSPRTERRHATELRAVASAPLGRHCAPARALMRMPFAPRPARQERMPAIPFALRTTTSRGAGLPAPYVLSRTALRWRPVMAASAASSAPPVTTRAAALARATTARPRAVHLVPRAHRTPMERRPA
jgi:hypothetical protein